MRNTAKKYMIEGVNRNTFFETKGDAINLAKTMLRTGKKKVVEIWINQSSGLYGIEETWKLVNGTPRKVRGN